MISYAGKRAIVTGGGGAGMGAAVVRELVAQGAEVHVLDLADAQQGVASFQRVDLSSATGIDAAIDRIHGDVDALFNCVGVAGNRTTALQTTIINYLAVRHLTERVALQMQAGSAIATVTSRGGSAWADRLDLWLELVGCSGFDAGIAWLREHESELGYRPSKEAANVWVLDSAVRLGATGIRHNAVLPGPTSSGMYEAFVETSGRDFMAAFPVPLGGRPQTVDDQADALLFLASDRAAAITGELLVVDGGTNAGIAIGAITMPALPAATAPVGDVATR